MDKGTSNGERQPVVSSIQERLGMVTVNMIGLCRLSGPFTETIE